MTKKKTFYITTPIYYTNADVHLGGAYTTIAADVLARWNRLQGKEVFFLTGTDEHGQKIQETAEKEGLKPKEFVDKIVKNFKDAFKMLNISNDNFIRTTDEEHEEEVKRVLQELYDKKFIYKGFYEAYYCIGCEQYLTQSDLVDGKCPLHNKEPELRKEEAYLFKLSSFQKKLLELIKTGKYEILPEIRRKEIITFIESGLQDISISRLKEKVSWGIELPFDKKHTCFVWVDAFWNYITGLQEKNVFDKFWPPDVQLMAKDIIRVHATIWPALLLATKNKLPKTLFVHGYFTVNGQKMSKSLGNVLSPIDLVKKYGADSVRYFLMRNIPFGQDGDFNEKALIERHNNELANKLGNLVSRVSALAEQNGLKKCENKLIKKFKLKEIEKCMENYEFDKALNLIFEFIDSCNLYVQEKKPWETSCKNKQQILYELVGSIKAIAILLWPFIPGTCEKISKLFGFEIKLEEINKPLKIRSIKKAEILFKKIDVNVKDEPIAVKETAIGKKPLSNKEKQHIDKHISKEKLIKQEIPGIITMNEVKYQDFAKLDLRVGIIKKVEEIEGADKLYKLEVDTGEKRIIVAGIKQFYKKDELKGKQIIVICNLEPRIMKGIESQGMLLAAVNKDKSKVILVSTDKNIDAGSKVE
jgi:methionyl-tRNA synthetase